MPASEMTPPARAVRARRAPWLRMLAAGVTILALSGCAATNLAESAPPITHGQHTATTPHSSPTQKSGGQFLATKADFAAVRLILARRAAAVRAHDKSAFLATVDRSRPSFYAAQATQFENLEALPVTSLSYQLQTTGVPNPAGITGKAFTPVVTERVFFGGTDRRPVANEIDETFVQKGKHWLLAADRIDLGTSSLSVNRPWAGPPLSVVVQGGLIVIADQGQEQTANAVAAAVRSDIAFDASVLHVPVNDKVMVDVTTVGSVGTFDNSEPAGAITFPAPASTSNANATAGLRVKLNPQYVTQLLQTPVILRHELTHFLMFRYTAWNPKWLTEGLAEYVAHQPAGLPSEYMTPEQYARLMNRPHVLTISSLFGQDPDTDYPLAMACVTYLVDHGGIDKVKTLMADYAAYHDQPFEDSRTQQVLEKVYGISSKQLADGAFQLLAALH